MTLKNMELTKNMIGKNNDKSGISLHFKHNKAVLKILIKYLMHFVISLQMLVQITPLQYHNPKNNLHLIFRIALNVFQIVCS